MTVYFHSSKRARGKDLLTRKLLNKIASKAMSTWRQKREREKHRELRRHEWLETEGAQWPDYSGHGAGMAE